MAKYDKGVQASLLARVFGLWWLVLLALLVGCDQQAVLDKFAPEVETKFARQLVDLFAAKNFSAIEAELAPELRQPDARSKFEEMARILPGASPISVKTVGAHTLKSQNGETYRLTFEYAYPDSKWVLVSTVLERRDGKLLLAGVHFQPLSQSLETLNRFTFEGKGPLHYVVLVLAILVPPIRPICLGCLRKDEASEPQVVVADLHLARGGAVVLELDYRSLGSTSTACSAVRSWLLAGWALGTHHLQHCRAAWRDGLSSEAERAKVG